MLPLVVLTAASGIHLVAAASGIHLVAAAAVACMCPAAAGNGVAAEVVVPPDMHCLPAVGAATAVVVYVFVIAAASVAGDAIVSVSVAAVVAGIVDVGVSMLTFLPNVAPSVPLVCPAQTCTPPSVLSSSNHVLRLFHQATSCAELACMHLRTCGPHHI